MLALLLLGVAMAQEGGELPELNAQLYRHPIDASATLWADDTGRAEHGQATAGLGFGYVRKPLVYLWDDGEHVEMLTDAIHADLLGAITLDRFRLGVDLPLYLVTTGREGRAAGFGDLALDVKASLVDRQAGPVGLALGARVTLPSTTVDAAVGAGGVGWEVQAIADREFGDLLLAANLGTRGVPRVDLENVVWNDQFFYRVGAGMPVTDALGVSLDVAGQIPYAEGLSNAAGSPLEALLGGWGRIDEQFVLRGGFGLGLTSGIGSPAARAVLLIAWEPPREKDADGDGLVDAEDDCPDRAEDLDGFRDGDGCPDLDDDDDGLVDTEDECRLEPEDLDGHRDQDGCPEDPIPVSLVVVDPDGNPVPGVVSMVQQGDEPVHAGGADEALGLNPGSYRFAARADGYEAIAAVFDVPDGDEVELSWVMTPVVLQGTVTVQVTDPSGAPLDARWSVGEQPPVPVEAGTASMRLAPGMYELLVRADGYVPVSFPVFIEADQEAMLPIVLSPSAVTVTRDKIDIADKVYFETAKAAVKSESFALLTEVATVIKDHPELTLIRIEGHTDSRGNDQYNLELSQERAAAVRQFLIDLGVEPDRLESEGFGETRPVDPREVSEAWEQNRRVEFFIAGRDD